MPLAAWPLSAERASPAAASDQPVLLLSGLQLAAWCLKRRYQQGARCAGRWKGAMVAVKIIEHSADINSKIEGFRENVVSSNIQHPNVVSL